MSAIRPPSPPPTSVSEEELKKKLPTFEDYVDTVLTARPDHINVMAEGFYGQFTSEMLRRRLDIMNLSQKHSGMFKEDTDEFKEKQKAWWFYYKKIMILRAFVLQYYGITPPVWKKEILPERLYCGTMLSEEDLYKFLVKEGSGLTVMKEDSVQIYERELKERNKAIETLKKNSPYGLGEPEDPEDDKEPED